MADQFILADGAAHSKTCLFAIQCTDATIAAIWHNVPVYSAEYVSFHKKSRH